MSRVSLAGIGLIMVLGFTALFSVGEEPKSAKDKSIKDSKREKEAPEAQIGNAPKQAVKESKLEKAAPATAIDFSGTFKLPFPSLTTLGARIEQARLAADPVALACLIRELAVAEQVSGKKAALTAETLANEVAELVKLRNQSTELEAVGLLLDDAKLRAELQKLAASAKKREAQAAEATKSGETARGLQGTLKIVNLHDVDMLVYVNGVYRGVTRAFQIGYFYVNHPPGTVSVFEVCYPDGSSRARWVMTDNVNSFVWNIDPNVE